ncbi:MAG: hypothetical protein IJU78_04835, partial [Clostridia bacterium]|nr:hypothetical protein [Clostridia bacterium]
MSHAEAMRQARVEFFVKQPIMAWAGGAVSGLMLGGAASGINAAQQAQYNNYMNSLSEDEATQNYSDTIADAIAEQAMAAESGNENAAPEGGAERRKISMEDFANNESPMWNMLDGADTAAQKQITQDTFDQMVTEGKVVKVSGETAQNVEQYYPDLRNMKKKDRTPILKQKMNELKSSLRSFLNDMRGTSYEFEVNGSILEAKLYGVGVNEVIDAVTEQKAKMLYASAEIFRNAQYLYSLPDTDGDPNIYRWNYFLAPVEIGEDTVAVRVAVRDMRQTEAGKPESQIYNWGIKKAAALGGGSPKQSPLSSDTSSAATLDASLGGAGRGIIRISSDASSETSDVANNISQKNSGVNTVYAEDGANIQRPRTLGEEMQRQMMQRGAADPSPYAGDPSAARQSRSAQDDSLTAESGGLRGLSLPTLEDGSGRKGSFGSPLLAQEDRVQGGMRNGQAETGGTESADAGAGGGAAQRGAESTNDKRDGGRIGGGRTAGKAGGVDTRARAAIHGTPERYRARAEVQALAKDLAARGIVTPKSAAELGVQNGTDARTLTVIPEEYWDKTRYGDVLHELRDAGYEVIAVSGRIETEADGVRTASNGTWIRDMYGDETVIIQLDSPKADPYQIAAHERGHSLLARGEGMSRQVWEHLRQKNVQELDRLLERYIRGMRGIADVDGALTAEQRQMVEDAIMEEILCDALGGMERYGERAGAIRGEVREAMTELYGEGAVARENSEAVRRTGEAAERHSIATIIGQNNNYGTGVLLDTNLFNGVHPRNWGRVLSSYVYNNLAGTQLTLYDANGNAQTVELAKKNDRTWKKGAKSAHRVIDELARYRGDNIRALATVHLSELLATSKYKSSNNDNYHGWLDSNGWVHRKTYVQDRNGNIYEALLNIAKGTDRDILYSVNNVRKIDRSVTHGAVSSTVSGGTRTNSNASAG